MIDVYWPPGATCKFINEGFSTCLKVSVLRVITPSCCLRHLSDSIQVVSRIYPAVCHVTWIVQAAPSVALDTQMVRPLLAEVWPKAIVDTINQVK